MIDKKALVEMSLSKSFFRNIFDIFEQLKNENFKAYEDRINEVPSEDDFDYRGILGEEYSDKEQMIIQCSFLFCQKEITKTYSLFKKHGIHDDKKEFLKLGTVLKDPKTKGNFTTNDGTPITDIALLNAAANYVKHHDEWNQRTILNGNPTINLLKCVGIHLLDDNKKMQNSDESKVINEILEVLKIKDNDSIDLSKCTTIIEDWNKEVFDKYKSILSS